MEIAFTRVKLPYGWLGNMAPYPIKFDFGSFPAEWRTSEALFQALRFDVNDPIREQIRSAKSPMAAKMLAKLASERMKTDPRSEQDVFHMRFVLLCKLECHKDLIDKLKVTGDARIIEDCTARQNQSGLFWGAARTESGWNGQNKLGELWMDLRDQVNGKYGPYGG